MQYVRIERCACAGRVRKPDETRKGRTARKAGLAAEHSCSVPLKRNASGTAQSARRVELCGKTRTGLRRQRSPGLIEVPRKDFEVSPSAHNISPFALTEPPKLQPLACSFLQVRVRDQI